jgi:RNA-binding protein
MAAARVAAVLPKAKPLGGKALRHLRALGHALDPVVAVGKNGVTASLVKQAELALLTHELIKVKVMQEAPEGRRDTAEELADKTGAVLAQVLGRTFLLYKRRAKDPKIVLPKAAGTAKAAEAAETAQEEEEETAEEDETLEEDGEDEPDDQ